MSTSWLSFKLGPARSFLPIGNFVMRRTLCKALLYPFWYISSIADGLVASGHFEESMYCNISVIQGRRMPALVCCSKALCNMILASRSL
jgi:hypothetical protein